MPKRAAGAVGAPPLQANVAELRALAHPLRLRILERFAEAPRTTKQVADLLGQPPTRLYHHVAALERAGLLRLKETRKNRGTVEKWYESASRTMSGAKAAASPKQSAASMAARRGLAMALLEQSRQEVLAAMTSPGADAPLLARLLMVAPPEREKELRTRLHEFLKEIQREFATDENAVPDERCERWAMTMTFAPCDVSPAPRTAKAAKSRPARGARSPARS
jgi:DNA-binding transcriptional ArsR family regulator